MLRRFSTNFALFSMVLDGLMVALTLYVSSYLRVEMNELPIVREVSEPVRLPWLLYLIIPALWVGIFLVFSVYDGRRNLKVADEMASVTMASMLATIAIAGVLFFSYREMSRFLYVFFAVETTLMLLFWRLALRLAFRWGLINKIQRRKVLMLGAGVVGLQVRQRLVDQPELGYTWVGFLDDDVEKQENVAEVLGPIDIVHDLVIQQQIDDVIVALPHRAADRLNWAVSVLHDLPVRVWVIPDYFSLALHRANVEELAGIPMLDLRAPALDDYQRMVKRTFDLMLVIPAMVPCFPIMAIIALAIRLDSPGPALFIQKRVGENGRLFDMIKFRTMVTGADKLLAHVQQTTQDGKVVHKSRQDPRVTRVGRFLRRTSLDELPQLFNVLSGEMSLVGPRPEMPFLVEKYELWQRKRFAVPQGMTGWWQINGRSDKPMHLHTEDDLYYVQHYSIWLDIQILIRTVWVVLRGKGAY
ncbi:MAG: sugar transferase [Anaerolineae bacterium]|nr:sugar transferase [Anaerolineae bacterium]